MDLEFIFGVILSLFAIIFAYDAINGEKVNGTLKLCFSNSVSRASFIGGKLAGSFVGLSVALIIPLLIGCALLSVLGVNLSGDEWLRLGLILVSGLAYFGLFLALTIGISAMTNKPSTSFLIGLVVWIFAVLITPRASVLISGRMVEVPNVDEITSEKNRYRFQLFADDRPKMADFSAPEGTEPQQVMQEFSKFMNELSEERAKKTEIFEEKVNEQYINKRRQQERLALSLSRISPTSVLSLATTELAGTSLDLQNRYMDSAQDYQQVYNDFMTEKTGTGGMTGFRMIISTDDDSGEEPETIDASELPEFQFQTATFTSASKESILDLGLLILFNLVFFGGAFFAFLKYDLR